MVWDHAVDGNHDWVGSEVGHLIDYCEITTIQDALRHPMPIRWDTHANGPAPKWDAQQRNNAFLTGQGLQSNIEIRHLKLKTAKERSQ